jgi:acetyltransferase
MVPDPTTKAKHLANPEPRPYPSRYVSRWTMKDGTEVRVRPIRPEDEPLKVKFHETLSDRTVYLRYFNFMSLDRRTAHERLLRICHGDYDREMVIVAECNDPQMGRQHIFGRGTA